MSIFLIITFIYFVYLYYSRTEITYEGDKIISIKQKGHEDIILLLPVEVDKWWNYLPVTNSKLIKSDNIERMKASRQNVVMSYVEITDANNQKINFVEKIIYGTRFPNEAEYSLKSPVVNQASFKIDRTDKLYDFLIECQYPSRY